jgi:cytochrome c5
MKEKYWWIAGIGIWLTSISLLALANAPLSRVERIDQNTAPVAQVTVNTAAAPAGAGTPGAVAAVAGDPGQQRYQQSCGFCHDSGMAGAPKLGDKAAWAPRLAQGEAVLVEHAIKGYKSMPAKGTCPQCSDKEIKEAADYMISKSK